ncbi:Os03g0705433 [Oryza sativa Japonica Group]|jgi:hypothetical protein|uniref:Os03g0705433 protein n=4 Tax=Oryza TaxID=4527 RepID=C7IZE6_ORYSJ|nr:hypothetical protein OsI_13204 [Oryza sativa Indica Group]KAB8093205.1 hypothetical protein EE612_019926 [Oryza sativa]KAF2940894.1 hypothetical protein DAI22_03g307466 [Oryza sativa Japonica Group]BAH92333.1 Os03g0705433 [Oryza sativa Japonica Group]BAS85976.1 Os03g0705433 [Oryza sativa Japonica Group]|eukprot:NP_001173605.1 Os03g0705433 [Oryza sativa Japonica Group]
MYHSAPAPVVATRFWVAATTSITISQHLTRHGVDLIVVMLHVTDAGSSPFGCSDPTSLLLSPSVYHRHRMLSSTGHLHGVLADTLRGYSAIATGSIYRLRLHGGSSNSLRSWQ